MAGITTICVTGFPPEALPRELKNLCRFMVGFEGAHVAFAAQGATSLFVKFNTAECAQSAIDLVTNQQFDMDVPAAVLRGEFARREMEVRPSSLLSPAVARTPVGQQAGLLGGGFGGGVGASRLGTTGGELVTIAVLGLREKGTDPESLRQWFSERPGFMALQINERIDAVFVKFTNAMCAEQGIQDANAQNLGAEWARRNLDDDRLPAGGQPLGQMPIGGGNLYLGGGLAQAPAMGLRAHAFVPQHNSEDIVTIAIMGLKEKHLQQEDLMNYFQQRPGFMKLQINERIGGCFVRFDSAFAAQQGLQDANASGFGADWARRNLDDDLGAKNAVMAQMNLSAGGYGTTLTGSGKRPRVQVGELDTITVLHMRDKDMANQGKIQQWFQERPGFVAMQLNERIDALFVKFSTGGQAEQAIQEANALGVGAEWARRNLDL